jgi:NAD(P)-dependent dehydrogenase (short-subunit alcohol dehydrogenase family)
VDLPGKHVVVTGAGSGIGRACATRFAAEGARVVVADRDQARVTAVAAEIGALAVAADVSRESDIITLIAAAEDHNGPIDLFFSNAGVAGPGGGPEAPDDELQLTWEINVMAHVWAARALLPGWLERGEGYFVATASAAGLLTQIGSAPYAVTKHAAVAFAEWLSVTYGERGIRVSCLCPMGVRTAMLAGQELSHRVVRSAGDVLEPEQVADAVVVGVEREQFLILPHPEVLTFFQRKGLDYERWLSGMRRLQARAAGGE